ncbi:unnamed protein product [Wuchereria bancrofti]|nr:unnamed protein product [Wuchereria bancrofti]
MCCAISDDENIIISGAKDSQIIIWATSTGNALISLKTESSVTALAINADATVILSANSSGWIEAHSIKDGKLLSSFNAHSTTKKLVASMDYHRILLQLANCSQLPILCLHNIPPNKLIGSGMNKKLDDYTHRTSKQSISFGNKNNDKNQSRLSTAVEKRNETLSKTTDYHKSVMQTDGKESVAPLHSILKTRKSLVPSVAITPASKSSFSKSVTSKSSTSSMHCPTKSNLCTVQ